MARMLLLAASAAAIISSATATAAVLVVRSSGPSAGTYPPGKALPDNHVLKLQASDTVILLDSRGTRTIQGPGNFSVAASAAAKSSRYVGEMREMAGWVLRPAGKLVR